MLRRGDTGDWIGTFDGHGMSCVWSCVLDRAALLAATGSADYTAKLWDAVTGDELYSWEHPHLVRSVHFAESRSRLATGCRDRVVRVLDVNAPYAELMKIDNLKDSIRSVKWLNNDSNLIVSFLNKPGLTLYDVRTCSAVRQLDTKDAVTSIDISHDGRHITTANGCDVLVYDAERLEILKSVTMEHMVESASVCMEKGLIAAGGCDLWAHVIDYHSGQVVQVNKGHHGPIHSIQFAPDGESFASGSEDGTIRIWFTKRVDARED